MPSDFRLPPVGFGPGSQLAQGGGDELSYMTMPKDMAVFIPHTPEVENPDAVGPALALIQEVAAACTRIATEGGTRQFDLAPLDAGNRALVADTLGEGEVSARLRGVPPLAVQETRFAGVWVLSGPGTDRIEVGAIPGALRTRAFAPLRPARGAEAPKGPGVINAPPIYAELAEQSRTQAPGAPPHVVNFTLLPHTEDDLRWLDAALGEGAVTILSRGYGNCRVTATALARVWRVQFFNSMDTLILDTLEVSDMPEVVLAAPEDLSDSGARLLKVLEAIG
ncbi:hydrogenase expression/formation protein [Roseicyclus sp.]|uniref:hydrogenase expression/formation protein n=1 Tax=Roseicyclus sp. TaxID=1914329 RepID=UPI003FA10163